jgi:hypothetical protein
MFSYCKSLKTTDFVIPNGVSSLNYLFYSCINLTTPIEEIIPKTGFALTNIVMNLAFSDTHSITGDTSKISNLLWNSGKTFIQCKTAFRYSNIAKTAEEVPDTWADLRLK